MVLVNQEPRKKAQFDVEEAQFDVGADNYTASKDRIFHGRMGILSKIHLILNCLILVFLVPLLDEHNIVSSTITITSWRYVIAREQSS